MHSNKESLLDILAHFQLMQLAFVRNTCPRHCFHTYVGEAEHQECDQIENAVLERMHAGTHVVALHKKSTTKQFIKVSRLVYVPHMIISLIRLV